MSDQLTGLETKIDKAVKDAPFQLPEKSRKAIADKMAIISLVIGVISLFAAYSLWNLARLTNGLVDVTNTLSQYYTGRTAVTSHLTAIVWVGIILLAVEGVLYLAAYPALKAKKKAGWNFLFYGSLVNLAHGIIMLFDSYTGGVGRLLGVLLSSAIGLYFLFQIRSYFVGGSAQK